MTAEQHPRTTRDEDATPHDALTRRRLLSAAAVAAAGAALPGDRASAQTRASAAAAPRRRAAPVTADVLIVGAGLSGLIAAHDLTRLGHRVIVLEARRRVGGRIWNHGIGHGEVCERGATFVGPTMGHLSRLAASLKVGTFDVYDHGQQVYVADGRRSLYRDSGVTGSAPPDPTILGDLARVILDFDAMAATVDVNAPWAHPRAREWDAITLGDYVAAASENPRLRELASTVCRPMFGSESNQLSLLFSLFYIAASCDEHHVGTFQRNLNTRQGAQMSRFVGGSQAIPLRLAAGLDGAIRLGQAVRRIAQTPNGVTAQTEQGAYRARRAVLALAPALAGRIRFQPALPPSRAALQRRLVQGDLIKLNIGYRRPFWREAGLSGQTLSLDGLTNFTFDDSPHGGSQGVVLAFVGGQRARRYRALSPAGRRHRVLQELAAYLGRGALKPTFYLETDWSAEPWTRGCPVGLAGPGTLSAYGQALRAPVGAIHWAGTETSPYWNGYMEGAVRSGQRAAREVAASL